MCLTSTTRKTVSPLLDKCKNMVYFLSAVWRTCMGSLVYVQLTKSSPVEHLIATEEAHQQFDIISHFHQ